jgi:uncharacterized protein YhaN
MENELPVIPPIDTETPPVENPPVPTPTPPVSDADLIKNPAVKTLIETARKQEKDKLYKTIDAKDEQIKTLTGRIEDLEKQLNDKESVNMEDMKSLQETITLLQQQQADLLKVMQEQKELSEKEKADALKAQRAAELKAYKEAQLREAGDELVVELVKGDTEEEIDQSIEFAKQKYSEILAKVAESQKGTSKQERLHNTPKVTNPPGGGGQPLTLDDIKKMTPAEFAKNRDAIMEASKNGLIK